MVLVLLANTVYPAVFFVCRHLNWQTGKLKIIENNADAIIYPYDALSAVGGYK